MTDTPRSISYLLTTEFQNGQPPGSITPQDMRDLIVTLQARSWVSVTQYGAAGDGTTNNDTAFANAIATGSSVILVPDGTYITTGITLNQANQMLWLMPGATLKLAAAGNAAVVTAAANNVSIVGGGVIDGNVGNVTSSTGIGIFTQSDILVDGIIIQNTTSYGVQTNHSSRVKVRNCKVTNTGNIGIFFQGSTASETIYDNEASFNWIDRSMIAAGTIAEGGLKVHADGTGANAQNTKIAFNTVLLPTSPTSAAAINIEIAYPSKNTVIIGNQTRGGQMGISLDAATAGSVVGNGCFGASTYGIELAACVRCTCDGNNIEGNGLTGNGIEIDDGSTGTTNDQNSVSNNSIDGCVNAAIKWFKANSGTCVGNTGRVAVAGKQVISVQNSNNISFSGGFYDAGSTSPQVINILDCSNLSFSAVRLFAPASGGQNVAIGTDVANAYDNIVFDGCNFDPAAAPVSISLFSGSSYGNNVAVMNCTGVVGSGTTNGNARRASCLDWTNQVWDIVGSGTPASSVTAGPGSVYRNQAGGTSTTFYVKESGTGNTGWVAK